jgi:carboxyl-terminal processing protease
MDFYYFNLGRCGRKFHVSWVWLLIFAAVAMAGCKPAVDNGPDSAEPNAAATLSDGRQPVSLASTAVDVVVGRILTGDFAGAKEACASATEETDSRRSQLAGVLARYDELQKKRDQKRQQAIAEQQKELDKHREKLAKADAAEPNEATEPNKIDETIAAVIRLRDMTPEPQRESLLKNAYVQKCIGRAKQIAQQDEKDGKWIEAYVHYYYWMTLLYEDNKEYKDYADRLTEMATIELSLRKDDCGRSAVERYKGIESFMFMRALQALEVNYVNELDYVEMCKKAIARCRLLGQVMADSKEELAWRADPNQLTGWLTQLDGLESEIKNSPSPRTLRDVARCFDGVIKINDATFRLPQEVVIANFSEAMMSAMDPFTNIVWPWNVRDFEKSMTQQFSGIGVEISKETGVLKIGSLLPDTPAYRASLDADDEIVSVNGESTEKMDIFCAVEKITGPRGTKVTLTMRRPSTGKTWDVTIVRDKIAVQPLRGWQRKADGQWDWMIDPANRIGYVRLTTFTETSAPDLDAVLTQMEKDGLGGLVLDLRYNPGGYLSSAAEVADLFVREGVIVKSHPRHGLDTYEIAHDKGTHPDYPLVILINENSASASEIVAGALQDPVHHRATLVGQRSYGKGSVQVVSPYTGGESQLKYTVAYYHLPSDQQVKNRYQMEKLGRKDWGVAPDVEVKMNVTELRAMLDLQRSNDVLVQANHDENKAPTKRSTLPQTLDSDPQLATALLVVQSRMIQAGQTLQVPQDPNTIVIGMATGNKK